MALNSTELPYVFLGATNVNETQLQLQIKHSKEKPKESALEQLVLMTTAVELSDIEPKFAERILSAAKKIHTSYCKKHAIFKESEIVGAKSFCLRTSVFGVDSLYRRIEARVREARTFPLSDDCTIAILQKLSIRDVSVFSRVNRAACIQADFIWKEKARAFKSAIFTQEQTPKEQLRSQFQSIRLLYKYELIPSSHVVGEKGIFWKTFDTEETLNLVVQTPPSVWGSRLLASYTMFWLSESEQLLTSALLDCGANPFTVGPYDQNTTLHLAIYKKQNVASLERLLKRGVDPNLKNSSGETPLHMAAEIGLNKHLRCLVKYGGRLDICNNSMQTLLHIAVENSRLNTIKMLLKYKVDVNAIDNAGRSPLLCTQLYWTFQEKSLQIVKLLLQHQADVNIQAANGDTILICALKEKQYDVTLELLSQNNIDVTRADAGGNTALHIAAEGVSFESVSIQNRRVIEEFADESLVEIIRLLLNKGAKLNLRNANGQTPYDRTFKRLDIYPLSQRQQDKHVTELRRLLHIEESALSTSFQNLSFNN